MNNQRELPSLHRHRGVHEGNSLEIGLNEPLPNSRIGIVAFEKRDFRKLSGWQMTFFNIQIRLPITR